MNAQRRVREILHDFSGPEASLAHLLCDRHSRDALAFTFVNAEGESVDRTYGELADESRRIASALRAQGIGKGDRVATLCGKSVNLPAVLLAIWRVGAVYVPLFTAFSRDVVTDRLAEADTRLVFVDAANAAKVPTDGPWLIVSRDTETTQIPLAVVLETEDDGVRDVAVGESGAIVHMFTSGTTGKPKGVAHPLAYAAGWQSYVELGLGVTAESTFWTPADPGWAYGLYTAIVGPLAAGYSTISLEGGFDVQKTWRTIDQLGVTDFAGAPTIYRNLLNTPLPENAPFSLKRLSSAGEPLTPEVNAWSTDKLGLAVHDHFGQTEVGMVVGFSHLPELETGVAERAMGHAFPGWQVEVIDEEDTVASTDKVGRLGISSSSELMTFSHYYGTGAATNRFTRDGKWYLTGDLASKSADGVLHFSSRDDDVIIMAGYRIGPFDVESVLVTHEAVAECAIIAVPDELRGEIIEAHIVLASGWEESEGLTAELQNLVRMHYAAHAYPRRIRYWTTLPKTPSGKIKRAELRAGVTT